MEQMGLHFTPLLFIPGVALIVLSTSNRLISLNSRILDIKYSNTHGREEELKVLERRVLLFRKALIGLYICIGLFSLVTLLNCFQVNTMILMQGLMTAGVAFLFYSILIMIRESLIAMRKKDNL